MANEPVDFAPIHNLLRYRPGMTGLTVTVAHEDNILTVSNAAGETVQCRYQDNNPAAMVHRLLAHYPTEATVNREEVQRFPFPDEAQMTCERPGRRVLTQRGYAGSRHMDGTPQESKILVEGLAYRYQAPRNEAVGADLHRNTAVIMPEPEGRKPHYWQARVYRARLNYRWEPDNDSQHEECQFNLNNWQHPEFVPSPATWLQLRDTTQRQLDKAAAKIRADAGVASVEWKQPPHVHARPGILYRLAPLPDGHQHRTGCRIQSGTNGRPGKDEHGGQLQHRTGTLRPKLRRAGPGREPARRTVLP